MDRHAGDDDEDVVVAEVREGLAKAVVLDWVFGFEEGGLHDGDIEGIGVGFECYSLINMPSHFSSCIG